MAKKRTPRGRRTPLDRARLDLKIQKERVSDGIGIYGDFAIRLRDEERHLKAVPPDQRPTVVAILSLADAVERLRDTVVGLHYGQRAESRIATLKRKKKA